MTSTSPLLVLSLTVDVQCTLCNGARDRDFDQNHDDSRKNEVDDDGNFGDDDGTHGDDDAKNALLQKSLNDAYFRGDIDF